MSEGNGSNGRRMALVAAIALVGGLVAGAGVIYVTQGFEGNAEVASSCPANTAIATAISETSRGEVAAVQPVAEPFDLSSLRFDDTDGQPTTLGDFSGKTLLVNLWATWCVPCRAEMPALDALERQEGGESFAVIPINVDQGSDEKPKAFYEETKLTALPFFRDDTMSVFTQLKQRGAAFGLPVSVIVDDKGCARGLVNGPAEWASPDAIEMIDAVKKAQSTPTA
ncbi:MAG: redoxin family protein [Fulvimarina manganoxydans]|uniref:thiol:disulfide interchange protein TlpA n=1 Tax=Fulvimarina manganoxydans TaxID=937218 RepID=UPI0023553058|nr:TlpA family protein disulfide reductase [Fulvimarina manganoxydans]MCK5932130.1 redoxin family protein [Fulvimarina manganoxydans]